MRPVSRTEEVRGQSWCLLGLVGDASYEKQRLALLDSLGNIYKHSLQCFLNLESEDFDTLESAFFEKCSSETPVSADLGLEAAIQDHSDQLEGLVNEPLVTFLEFSDDSEHLIGVADKLAQTETFKHITLAVVRMYEWINLNYSVQDSSRRKYRDEKCNSFFSAMRAAEVAS